ncbi:MAG: MOSC N-terminal beta barrel domain-containing protein [Bacteroidota bacterium]
MVKIKGIYTYPIKSFLGIPMNFARLNGRGLQFDRRWMLVDESGRFVSQREEAALCFLSPTIMGNKLIIHDIREKDFPPLELSLYPTGGKSIMTSVFEDELMCELCEEEVAPWMEARLGTPYRMVYQPDSTHRKVDPRYAINEENVSLADAYPYMLLGQASLDALNEKMSFPMKMNRFRPNILVEGTEAFEEDSWGKVTIGKASFQAVKPCARCSITTIDQKTAIQGKEPLKTLASFRKSGRKILFGQHLLHLSGEEIAVGDILEVHSTKEIPLFD